MAMGATHGWLRLLIAYHFPDLVIHLDRVLGAGWEQAAKSPPPAEVGAIMHLPCPLTCHVVAVIPHMAD